jgi:hypothetical protein
MRSGFQSMTSLHPDNFFLAFRDRRSRSRFEMPNHSQDLRGAAGPDSLDSIGQGLQLRVPETHDSDPSFGMQN